MVDSCVCGNSMFGYMMSKYTRMMSQGGSSNQARRRLDLDDGILGIPKFDMIAMAE